MTLAGGTLRNGALTGAVTSTGGMIDGLGGSAASPHRRDHNRDRPNGYTGATTVKGGTFNVLGSVTASNITVTAAAR